MDEIKKRTLEILMRNRREKDGFQYTVPSPDSYPYQWFWDSCFHSIMLSYFDIEDAKKELRSVVSKQFENGLIPHVIYWEKHDVLEVDWGVKDTSSLTQPPIIAYAVWKIFNKEEKKGFLLEMYPKLARYYKHLLTRDPHHHHLVSIINPDESGEDNSPRFDEPLGLEPVHKTEDNNHKRFDLFDKNKEVGFNTDRMEDFFWVKDVAFNSYLIENLDIMKKIAIELGYKEEKEYFEEQLLLMKQAMREFMYEDEIFWSTYGADYKKIKTKTWAIFAPMITGILTQEEAIVLVEKYLKDEKQFWSEFLLPTVSLDEKSFNPEESKWGKPWQHPNWRGPIWMATNWFVYRGLKNYGFKKEAEMIKQKSIELLEKSGFREYYNPKTGEGMGAQNFTWGGLVLDMN